MIYSIQNEYGEVYDSQSLPEEAELSCEEWAGMLVVALEDILGYNGVTAGERVLSSQTGERVECVTIDIEPVSSKEQARIQRIHDTVGIIATAPNYEG